MVLVHVQINVKKITEALNISCESVRLLFGEYFDLEVCLYATRPDLSLKIVCI